MEMDNLYKFVKTGGTIRLIHSTDGDSVLW